MQRNHKSVELRRSTDVSRSTEPVNHSNDKVFVAQTLGIIKHRHSFHHVTPRQHRNETSKLARGSRQSKRALLGKENQYGSLDHPDTGATSNADDFDTHGSNLCDWRQDLLSLKELIKGSYLNILLILLPFCFISYYAEWNGTSVFFINFLTMIPLASILGDATECLAEHLGEIIGGLLNATFGNAVEIVVTLLALVAASDAKKKDDCEGKETLLFVVQTSLIGSIFSNSLLVLGCVLFGNGVKFSESRFNTTAVSSSVTLLMIAGFVMILPAPYANLDSNTDELIISRAAAVILIIMYVCSLIFVLYTHRDIFETDSDDEDDLRTSRANSFSLQPVTKQSKSSSKAAKSSKKEAKNPNANEISAGAGASGGGVVISLKSPQISGPNASQGGAGMGKNDRNGMKTQAAPMDEMDHDGDESGAGGIVVAGDVLDAGDDASEDDELEMSLIGSMLLLLGSTVLVAVLSEYLVDSIEPMTEKVGMSEAFVGVILIPIIGNAVEHLTAVRMAIKNKMDIALSIAIGSAAQVALFVVPLAVLIAWIMDLELALDFESFEVYMFILSTVIIYAIVNDGKSNWLEGVMLLGLYLLIAIAVWDQTLEKDCP